MLVIGQLYPMARLPPGWNVGLRGRRQGAQPLLRYETGLNVDLVLAYEYLISRSKRIVVKDDGYLLEKEG